MLFRAVLSVALLGTIACSCKSTGVDAAEKTSGTLRQTYEALEAAPQKMSAVKADLADLRKADGDMAAQFKKFTSDLGALKSHRQQILSLRQQLEDNKKAFNTMWTERAAAIKDADMRALAESRREALVAEFKKIADASKPGSDAVGPWLQSLDDLSTFLEFNLNKEGIAAVSDQIDTAIDGAEPIEEAIATTLEMMKELGDRIEATKPPPPPAPEGDASKSGS